MRERGFAVDCEKRNGSDGRSVCETDEAVFLLNDAFHRLVRSHFKAMSSLTPCGSIPPAQVRCLLVLEKREGICQRELAELLYIEKATATVMLQKMQRKGLIDRRQDAEDQRMTRIYLTPCGREKTKALKSASDTVLKEAMSCISGDDKIRFAAVLNKMSDKFCELQNKYDTRSCDV